MTNKIESLTDAQIALLPKYREQWMAHGLSTEPTDREATKVAICKAYKGAKLDPPKMFVWLPSPRAGCYAAATLAVAFQDFSMEGVTEEGWDRLWEDTWRQVEDQTHPLYGAIKEETKNQVGMACYGSQDSAWSAFFSFFYDNFGIGEGLEGLSEVSKQCGWWWPFDDVAVVTDRPTKIMLDDQDRLHCEDGPALSYGDGFAVWSWHGLRIPRKLIEEPITSDQIRDETNTEIRRVMIERYGLGKYLQDIGAKQIDAHTQWGILWEYEDQDMGRCRVLECVNGSPEPDGSYSIYHLQVPPDVPTALAAVAWTYGVTPEEYEKLQLRT